jgi:predicted DNA-binding antitoxin AbrB/MazE fold protein
MSKNIKTIKGIYHNGVIKPLDKVELKEGTIVTMSIDSGDSELSQRAKSQLEFLNKLKAKGLIKDIPQKGLEKIPPFAPIKVKGKPVSQTVIEDRGRE